VQSNRKYTRMKWKFKIFTTCTFLSFLFNQKVRRMSFQLHSHSLKMMHCHHFIQKSKLCYDRRSAGQSVLKQSTHLGLTTRSWLLPDICGFLDLGRPLWREDGSAVCNCYWSSPAQSFSGPSPVGLYCLRFETSLFVASYDSQGHGGGIRPRLHTGHPKRI
jgi:hypothetical protein